MAEPMKSRVATQEKSAAQHEKQIKAIRALVHEGVHLMVETRRDLRATGEGLKRIEAALELHIIGRRSNGHTKRKMD